MLAYAWLLAQEIDQKVGTYRTTFENIGRTIIFILAVFGIIQSIVRGGTITKIAGALLCGAIALASLGLLPGLSGLIERDTKTRFGTLPPAEVVVDGGVASG